MPKNRQDLDNSLKKQMIKDSARNIFLADGYEKTSITRISKQAGVTANTIYWYFSGKDELFAAVLEELISVFVSALSQRSETYSLEENLLWMLESFQFAKPLIITVHERSAISDAVATVHNNFHNSVESLLGKVLNESGFEAARIKPVIRIASFVVEGLLMHEVSIKEKQEIVKQLLAILSPLRDK